MLTITRSLYTASLNFGASGGTVISGLITINHGWRYIYFVATPLIGMLTILVVFTMPETSYIRNVGGGLTHMHVDTDLQQESQLPAKKGYSHTLKLYHGKLTNESVWRIFMRPIIMLALPPVLWAVMVMSVTIGTFIVSSLRRFWHHYWFRSRLPRGDIVQLRIRVSHNLRLRALAIWSLLHSWHHWQCTRDLLRRCVIRLGSQLLHQAEWRHS